MHTFAAWCAELEKHLTSRYGIPVVTRDIPDPLTGDLNGAEIHIDWAVTPEQRLFLLAHLFGHTVQWNIDQRKFTLGRPQRLPVRDDLLPALLDYEREAAAYGLTLLHQASITAADQWYGDYSACDAAYLMHYYRTGEKSDFRSFWRDGAGTLTPLAIPPFKPARRIFRLDGVVI